MPIVGAMIEGEAVGWDDIPPALFLPEFVNAMRRDERNGLHMSDLLGCPFDVVRKRRYNFYLPVKNLYFMVRGKAWDALTEKYCVLDRLTQVPKSRMLDDVMVWGTPDIVDLIRHRIEDTKSPVSPKGYQEIPLAYVLQVNAYRWLWGGYAEGWELRLNACTQFGFEQLEVPVFPQDDIEDELSMRLHALKAIALLEDVVPQCDNHKCYCYSDGFIDTSNPVKWGLEELYDAKKGTDADNSPPVG